MADLPLIAWDEVPEGHYVWCRQKGHDAVDWQRWRRRHDDLVTPGGTWIKPDLYEFTLAEQQPGEWAAKVARLTQERDDWKQSFIEANKAAEAAVDLADLRDGLTALEQEMREHHASGQPAFDFQLREWADRLAALREGQE